MEMVLNSIERYQRKFAERNFQLVLLNKEEEDLDRLMKVYKEIDSIFFVENNNEIELRARMEKLIRNAYNFILTDGDKDVALLCLYANDPEKNYAFITSIGMLSAYQEQKIGGTFAKMSFELAKELGFKYVRAEVDKENAQSLVASSHYFEIGDETEHGTIIIERDVTKYEPKK